MSGEQLIQLASVTVQNQHMPVALPVRPTLDGGIRRNRIRSRIALIRVVEPYRHTRLVAPYNDVGNAAWSAIPDRAEIGMQRPVKPDAGDKRIGVRIDRVV